MSTVVIISESYGQEENTIFRGMLQWQPTDSFQALFTAGYNRVNGNMQAQCVV